MTELLLLVLGTVLVNNFVLVQFLGLCPFMGVSRNQDSALGMALATTFVLTLAAASSWLIEHTLLRPLQLDHLRTLSFIVVIAASVQLTDMWLKRTSPLLHEVLGIYLPLITSNCAVLGVALLQARQEFRFSEAVFFGFGAALGFSLVLLVFAHLRERLAAADVPAPFQGAPIALISASIMALAFLGFSGIA